MIHLKLQFSDQHPQKSMTTLMCTYTHGVCFFYMIISATICYPTYTNLYNTSLTNYDMWCMGPFYIWLSKFLANGRRCYICNVFSHWLRPCSSIDREHALMMAGTFNSFHPGPIRQRQTNLLSLNKMIYILQTTFSNVFFWKKMLVHIFSPRLSMFLQVQLSLSQHWIR